MAFGRTPFNATKFSTAKFDSKWLESDCGNKMRGRAILLSFRFLAELLNAARNGRYKFL